MARFHSFCGCGYSIVYIYYIFSIHSSISRHLGCFNILIIVANAAWNMKVKVAQSSLTLCNPVDSTVHGILQARILEWVAFPFSRGSSQTRNWTSSPSLQADSSSAESQGKPKNTGVNSWSLLQGIVPTQELNWGLLHWRWILYQLSYQGTFSFGTSEIHLQ